jgi:NADPH:quinone reductase-like Zn-dependent oxidoreductase
MRALEIGDGAGLDAIRLVERPDPTPGPDEVLLRMKAVSLNYRDLLTALGSVGRTPAVTPFSDGCGVVEAIGANVTRVKVGDRVATLFFEHWIAGRATPQTRATALGAGGRAAGAELVVLHEDGVSKVPDFLTDHGVATLPCAALTAWRGLFEDADLEPGDTVVLQGTGGVSIFGLQFAHAAGMRTVITSSSDEKLDRAHRLGADHLVNYKTTPEWSGPVRDATGGRGADFVMEVGGADTLPESMKSIRIGGHIAIIGVLSGFSQALQFGAMIATSARLVGLSVGSRDMFEAMCRSMELRGITPVVDKVFDWTEAKAAFMAMRAGEHFGKIVLDFGA